LISLIVFSVFFSLKVRNFGAGIFTFDFKGLLSVDSAVVVVCERWGRERAILKVSPSGFVGVSLPLRGKNKIHRKLHGLHRCRDLHHDPISGSTSEDLPSRTFWRLNPIFYPYTIGELRL
jgi:hypothetical protein